MDKNEMIEISTYFVSTINRFKAIANEWNLPIHLVAIVDVWASTKLNEARMALMKCKLASSIDIYGSNRLVGPRYKCIWIERNMSLVCQENVAGDRKE